MLSTNQTTRRSRPVGESMDSSGIWAFESRHDEAFFMGPTRHDFLKLLLIREGAGVIRSEAADAFCRTGDCIIVPPKLQHRIVDEVTSPIALYGLGIDTRLLSFDSGAVESVPGGVVPARRARLLGIEQRMRRLLYLHARRGPAARLAGVATALDLLARLALASDAPASSTLAAGEEEPLLDEYLSWLTTNFFEPVSLSDAADRCGVSRRYFTAAFKRRTGGTWLTYVTRLRTDHAVRLLRETNRKITSVAFQSGFEEMSTFYRAIRKQTGRTPTELRAGRDRATTGEGAQ